MAVNHTVIREEKSDGTVELTASSPDEQAFVAGAFVAGVQFLGMDYETSVVKLEVRVLHVIPYESSRKRMSMIVELPDGHLVLFCKVREGGGNER